MAKQVKLEDLDMEDQVRFRMLVYGVGRMEAEFITAMELGEIDGDTYEVSETEAEAIEAGLFDDDTRTILQPDQVPDE